jgi:hypothetical protein
MGNNPVSGTDPDGGFCPECDELAALGYNVLPEVTITASFTGQIAGSLAGLTGALGRGVEYMQNPRGDLFYVHNTNEGSQVLKVGRDGWEMHRDEIKLAKINQLNMYGFADKIGETTQSASLLLATGPAMDLAVAPVLKVAGKVFGRIISRVASRTATSLWPAASGGRAVINGIEYTTHALERMQPVGTIMKGTGSFSRGIPPSVVENAIKFGKVTPGNTAAEVVRTFENVRVITNPQGTRVISVIKIGN